VAPRVVLRFAGDWGAGWKKGGYARTREGAGDCWAELRACDGRAAGLTSVRPRGRRGAHAPVRGRETGG